MVFETAAATVDQVRARHRNEEVREFIPADDAGMMGCDWGKSYDARELAEVAQQKCLAPVQRNLSDGRETQRGRGRWFAQNLKHLLTASLHLWHADRAGVWREDPEGYAAVGTVLVEQLTDH